MVPGDRISINRNSECKSGIFVRYGHPSKASDARHRYSGKDPDYALVWPDSADPVWVTIDCINEFVSQA